MPSADPARSNVPPNAIADAMPEQKTKISVASEKPHRAGIQAAQASFGVCAIRMTSIAMPRKKSSRGSRATRTDRAATVTLRASAKPAAGEALVMSGGTFGFVRNLCSRAAPARGLRRIRDQCAPRRRMTVLSAAAPRDPVREHRRRRIGRLRAQTGIHREPLDHVPLRGSRRRAGQRHDLDKALRHQILAGFRRVRPDLPEAEDGGVDETRGEHVDGVVSRARSGRARRGLKFSIGISAMQARRCTCACPSGVAMSSATECSLRLALEK